MYEIIYCSYLCNGKVLEIIKMSINRDLVNYLMDGHKMEYSIVIKMKKQCLRTDIKISPRFIMAKYRI